MKHIPLSLVVIMSLFMSACSEKTGTSDIDINKNPDSIEINTQNTGYEQSDSLVGEDLETLNDVRFKGWGKKEWLDNDYIRTLRNYIDDFQLGKITDDNLFPYKEKIKGEFIVGSIEPTMVGGVFIKIIFIDMPDRVFTAWIYSYVDLETTEITGYDVRNFYIEEDKYDNTKEDILKALKEDPLLKLW